MAASKVSLPTQLSLFRTATRSQINVKKGSNMTCATLSDSLRRPDCWAIAWVLPAAILLTALAALIGFYVAASAPALSDKLLHEGGPVEVLSALALLAGALVMTPLIWRLRFASGGYLPVLVGVMGLRELDFDKRFTDAGVLQARLYTGDFPLIQQLIGGAILLGVLTLVLLLLRHCWRLWREGSWHHLYPSLALSAAGWLVLAKTVDGAGRKLASFGVTLPPDWPAKLAAWEELLEMMAAMLIYGLAMKCVTSRQRALAHADTSETATK